MLSAEFVQLAAMALAGLAVGGVVYVLVMPYMSGERKASKRVGNVARAPSCGAVPRSTQIRKQHVQDTIKNIEAKQKLRKRVRLRIRLVRAGLSMKPRTYYLLSASPGRWAGHRACNGLFAAGVSDRGLRLRVWLAALVLVAHD